MSTYTTERRSTGEPTVLLVDGGPTESVASILETAGFAVETASPDEEVLERVETRTADCVLLSAGLSDDWLRELLTRIGDVESELPVVVLIEDRSSVDVSDLLEMGVTDILEQPTDDDGRALFARRLRNYGLQYRSTQPGRAARSDRWLGPAFEHSPDAIFVHDAEGTILEVNQQACESLGYNREELLEMAIPEVEAGIDSGDLEELWNDADFDDSTVVEGRHRRKDGSEFPVQVSIGKIGVGDDERFVAIARDVTEREKRERELRTFREAVEHAGHVVVITDTSGTIEYVNPAFEEVTGYDREEVIGRTPSVLKSGEHGEAFYADLWTTILSGERWHSEMINEHKDGTQYVVDKTIAPIVDEDGTPKKFVAINREVTERKEYERQLTELHDATQRSLAADTKAEVAEIAVDAAERLLGFSIPSVWFPTDEGDGLEVVANTDKHRRLLEAAGTPSPCHPRGSWVWDVFESGETAICDSLSPSDLAADVPVQSGVVVPLGDHGILTCGAKREGEFDDRDVTLAEILGRNVTAALEQVEHSAVLERHRQYTEDLLDTLEDVIYVLDRDGVLEHWNESLADVTGYECEEIATMNAVEFFPDDGARTAESAIEEAFRTGRTHVELEFLTKDGETIPYEFVANTFENPEGQQVLGGIGRDLTARKEYERTLREQNEQLEKRQEQIQFFNSLLRHDILNGMTVIRGYSEILLEEFEEGDDLYPIVESVYIRSDDIVELTQEVRSVLRRLTEEGEITLEAKPLEPIVGERIDRLSQTYPEAIVDATVSEEAAVIADELLDDVLNNVLMNAVQHSDRDQPRINLEVDEDDDVTTIRVADDGPGVSDERKEVIFKQGKGDPDTSTGGFGLFFVKTMVERYGGDVRVEDNEPRGAVFVIELPRA